MDYSTTEISHNLFCSSLAGLAALVPAPPSATCPRRHHPACIALTPCFPTLGLVNSNWKSPQCGYLISRPVSVQRKRAEPSSTRRKLFDTRPNRFLWIALAPSILRRPSPPQFEAAPTPLGQALQSIPRTAEQLPDDHRDCTGRISLQKP